MCPAMTLGSPPLRSSSIVIALPCVLAAALLALTVLLYHVPSGFVGKWGMYGEGARMFASWLPFMHDVTPMPVAPFVWSLRVLLITAWLCWGSIVVFGFQGRLPPRRFVVGLSVALAAALVVFAPPVLSNDVLTYAGYARLFYTHQANPYFIGPATMPGSDLAHGFLLRGSLLPYGPLWLVLALRFSPLGSFVGAPYEVMAHKLLAAASLLVVSIAGARLAERREAGRGPLTFATIALNPLLLIEGPLSGHNDVLMMAFIVGGAALYATERRRWAAAMLGLAVAVKLTALAVLPPLFLVEWQRPSRETRLLRVAWTVVLVAAPFIALSWFFGGPRLLFSDALAQSETAQYRLPLALQTVIVGGALLWSWAFVRGSREPSGWLTAAIPIVLASIVTSGVLWFPWHLTWALVPALIGWDERHRSLNVALTSGAVVLTILYTVS
jgi:hypothetical protein